MTPTKFTALYLFIAGTALAGEISFNRDIRPILSDKCWACHGPDAAKREGNRRLDTPDGAAADLEGIRAIVPGEPAKSDAIERIFSDDKDEVMPPAKHPKKLMPREKELLKQWVAEGAKYEAHWSFIPPTKAAVPASAEANPIDAFLAARLQKDGLAFSPEAEPATILRRLYFDLIGLPPSLAELDAFTAEAERNLPLAVSNAAKQLMTRPTYGEKRALAWLDLARFADTHGYHLDAGRDMTAWREWVIGAFNRNQRFDEFVLWQLAGDLLPAPTTEQRLATGFMRNNMINFEGGAIAEEYHNAYIVDRVSTFGTAFLGLSVACAQCHDHKFDPISQKEFYQLYAYFNAVPEKGLDGSNGNATPTMELPTQEQEKSIAAAQAALAAAEKYHAELSPKLAAAQKTWEQSLSSEKPAQWITVAPVSAVSKNGSTLAVQPDHSVLASGANPASDIYEISVRTALDGVRALRVEALPDKSLAGGGTGRANNGNFVLTKVRAEFAPASQPEKFAPVPITSASADYEQNNYPAADALSGKGKGWAVDGDMKKDARALWLALEKPFGATGGGVLKVRLEFNSGFAGHAMGRVRIGLSRDAHALAQTKLPAPVRAVLAKPAAQRSDRDRAQLAEFFLAQIAPEGKAARDKIEAAKAALAAARKNVRNTMVMAQMEKPRPTHILNRGLYNQPGERVEPAPPVSFGKLADGAPANRLGLAGWLIDPKHPLLARVTVNRIWAQIMGTGLVKTVNDFGAQGEWPTHPELLDWLAVDFVEHGWDVKRLIGQIVTSRAYRQTARVTPNLRERDPENRLYARGPRFRLAAEEIRDTALAVSGLLDPRIGGESVLPYQPAGLWEELSSRGDSKKWSAQFFVQSKGADLYRRSLYTFVKRTCPPPQMSTFDAPDREVCTAQRERTNTPLQALVMLNETGMLEAARKFAERIVQQGGADDASRLRWAFRNATARRPSDAEVGKLAALLAQQRARYAQQPEMAKALLSHGEAPPPPGGPTPELAAWSVVAGLLLNLDETVTK